MKILIIVDNLYNGGAGRVASVLANAFIEKNIVYCVVKEPLINYKIHDNVHFHVLSGNFSFYKLEVIPRLVSYIRLIRHIKPDIIISLGHVSKYTTMANWFSKNKICIIDSERSDPNQVPSSTFMKWIRNRFYGMADCLVCQTYQAKEYYKKILRIPIAVIPNPLTPNLPYWNGIDSFNIISACRLHEQKNIPMLIRAFNEIHKIYPYYKLHIYGEGPLKNELQQKIDELGLNDCIHLLGSTRNLHEILANSFMFVSSSDHEGLSNSMLEAMAIGIPVVCTDCPIGGASMFIRNKVNGILTPIKDSDNFFKSMKYVIDNKKLLADMSKEAIKIREDLDASVIAKQWYDIINYKRCE